MKKFLAILALISLTASVIGCTSRTMYGECVGVSDKQRPDLEYKLSAWNLFVGIVFWELIAPPIIIAVDETYCPVGHK